MTDRISSAVERSIPIENGHDLPISDENAGTDMVEPKTFTVELEITRSVTAIVEAENALAAREKAHNLEFKHEIPGEITHWVVKSVTASDPPK